ncbi:MAG TPA: 3-dehydroquinate synthase [Caulobacteraceae bacterium]|nr:3-dehydroquinate synthase [Caulobacteraceae bacterium]
MSEAVAVDLEGRSYDVRIGRGLVDSAGRHVTPLLKRPLTAVVMDRTVADLHGERLLASLRAAGVVAHPVIVPPGEETKSFSGLAELCDELLALELERSDHIIAFGGGVVGDLAGFAAAIFKRGIGFIQIPTTLLAQVDSSVGGKTAIDTARGKNLIGAFHQPRLVLADLGVLTTLPRREMACGYAEVLKYGLLGDADFFAGLEAATPRVLGLEDAALVWAVRRCVEMKARIVAEDEREGGRRALLNLGHTFGHAVEAATGFGEALKHGEAVALGCALAFRFSLRLGLCPGQDATRAERAIAAAGLPTRLADIAGHPFRADALIASMAQDKKAQGGALTFILVRGIGDAFVAKGVDPAPLRDFLIDEGALP